MPSIHSSVSTRLEVRRQSRPHAEGAVGQGQVGLDVIAISEMAAASSRRSISISTERASVSTTAVGRRRREGWRRSIWRRRRNSCRGRGGSGARCRGVDFHRHVARDAVVGHTALCTWAMEAAAIGGPNLAK